MKVILSRKGFDSSCGAYPSPILPDGKLISLPIPSIGDPLTYNDLCLEDNKRYLDLIFLFFGWFRKTEEPSTGKLIFTGPDLHVIFGYFQIGKILPATKFTDVPEWMLYHPHTLERLRKDNNNTIYAAREKLSWNNNFQSVVIL